jgi:D-glycero-D-manno-heptose 1,7-bisphosphate phosphatase
MTRIPAGEIGSLTRCSNGVLRFPLTNHRFQTGAIFLDRDGVINRRIPDGYVTRLADFAFLPDAIPGMRALASLDRPIIIVSNQAGVAKRVVTARALEQITSWFVSEIVANGGRVDAVYYCPHAPADECPCRKPKPGLFLQAATDLGVDLTQSAMIGDSVSDAEAAINAGSRALLVPPDHLASNPASAQGYELVADLRAAAAVLKSA